MSRTKTLELAMEKAATLPASAQDQIGREVLERVETIAQLLDKLEIGIEQLDAGRGEVIDLDDLITQSRAEHGKA